jgi:hypothetical protein
MQQNRSTQLLQSLILLDLKRNDDYQQDVSNLLDEQPYLMGFLFNLEEDFSELSHELIIRASLALHHSLSSAGLYFHMITPEMLQKVIQQQVEAFEKIDEDDEFHENDLLKEASSPVALKELVDFVDQNTRHEELSPADRTNLLLILNALIEIFETAATPTNPEGEN